MFSIRLFAIPLLLLALPLSCFGDEVDAEAPSVKSARSRIEPYINWLPAKSQTLIVSESTYEIPAELPPDASLLQMHLTLLRIFEGEARDVLVDKNINLWIEAASRFYFPEFPDEVEDVQTVGMSTHYDGCHILVFDERTPPDTAALFEKLLQQHSEPTSLIPAGERHRIEGYDTIAWSSSPPRKRDTGRETPADTLLINATLSIRYWIASPVENVLVVATTREILAETLRKIQNPDQAAFPAASEEWRYITGEMPTWGIRHFPEEADPSQATGLERGAAAGHISGLTVKFDSKADKAVLTFLNCSQDQRRALQSSIPEYTYSEATFTTGPGGSLVAHLDWSKEAPEDELQVERRLGSWVRSILGHAFVI
jgi:hypothetical protein